MKSELYFFSQVLHFFQVNSCHKKPTELNEFFLPLNEYFFFNHVSSTKSHVAIPISKFKYPYLSLYLAIFLPCHALRFENEFIIFSYIAPSSAYPHTCFYWNIQFNLLREMRLKKIVGAPTTFFGSRDDGSCVDLLNTR